MKACQVGVLSALITPPIVVRTMSTAVFLKSRTHTAQSAAATIARPTCEMSSTDLRWKRSAMAPEYGPITMDGLNRRKAATPIIAPLPVSWYKMYGMVRSCSHRATLDSKPPVQKIA